MAEDLYLLPSKLLPYEPIDVRPNQFITREIGDTLSLLCTSLCIVALYYFYLTANRKRTSLIFQSLCSERFGLPFKQILLDMVYLNELLLRFYLLKIYHVMYKNGDEEDFILRELKALTALQQQQDTW